MISTGPKNTKDSVILIGPLAEVMQNLDYTLKVVTAESILLYLKKCSQMYENAILTP